MAQDHFPHDFGDIRTHKVCKKDIVPLSLIWFMIRLLKKHRSVTCMIKTGPFCHVCVRNVHGVHINAIMIFWLVRERLV